MLFAGGRLLLHVPLGQKAGALKKRGEKKSAAPKPVKVAPGTLVAGTLTSVHATHAAVQLESGTHWHLSLSHGSSVDAERCTCWLACCCAA